MNKIITTIISLFFLLIIFSCGNKKCTESYLEINQIITKYHDKCFPKMEKTNTEEQFSIYLDYSGSMKIAFSNKPTGDFYDLFINSLKISTVDFFEVADLKVIPIKKMEKSELYKKIKDTKKFTGNNAPLNTAISEIIDAQKEAVLITDGELWENGERNDPWAREEFEKWIKQGNAIDFFVTDHLNANKENHVFYMFFIPKKKYFDKNNISNQFKFYLENSIEAKSLKYINFSFSINTYKLIKEYKTATSGGVNENTGLDETSYINGENFEYQDYMMKWKDMIKYIKEATDANGNQINSGEPIISKLFVETSGLEFYTINELGIKVYNVKDDLEKFKLIEETKLNRPTFQLDENGQILLDEQNHPIVDCPGMMDSYNEYGELILDTNFIPSKNLNLIDEVFDFDNVAFMNNFRQQGRGEIVIKFHQNFNGTQIDAKNENLLRIDVYLKNVSPKTDNPNLSKFIWQGKQVERNTSIYNSILGALNNANPQGQIIYSYYIKTLGYK